MYPRELVEAVDRLVRPRQRSAFVVLAVAEKISRERLDRALATTAGFLSEGTHPEWKTPQQVWVWAPNSAAFEVHIDGLARVKHFTLGNQRS